MKVKVLVPFTADGHWILDLEAENLEDKVTVGILKANLGRDAAPQASALLDRITFFIDQLVIR